MAIVVGDRVSFTIEGRTGEGRVLAVDVPAVGSAYVRVGPANIPVDLAALTKIGSQAAAVAPDITTPTGVRNHGAAPAFLAPATAPAQMAAHQAKMEADKAALEAEHAITLATVIAENQ